MDTTNPIRSKLRIPVDAMYRLLREGCITEFNVKKASGDKVDLRGAICVVSIYGAWMPMGWTSATATFARQIYAVSILAKRGLKARASMLRRFPAPTSPLN